MKRFRDIAIGETFEFSSVRDFPFSGMARGPWEKTGSRTYRKADGSDEERGKEYARIYGYKYKRQDHKVGSINAEVL